MEEPIVKLCEYISLFNIRKGAEALSLNNTFLVFKEWRKPTMLHYQLIIL